MIYKDNNQCAYKVFDTLSMSLEQNNEALSESEYVTATTSVFEDSFAHITLFRLAPSK